MAPTHLREVNFDGVQSDALTLVDGDRPGEAEGQLGASELHLPTACREAGSPALRPDDNGDVGVEGIGRCRARGVVEEHLGVGALRGRGETLHHSTSTIHEATGCVQVANEHYLEGKERRGTR